MPFPTESGASKNMVKTIPFTKALFSFSLPNRTDDFFLYSIKCRTVHQMQNTQNRWKRRYTPFSAILDCAMVLITKWRQIVVVFPLGEESCTRCIAWILLGPDSIVMSHVHQDTMVRVTNLVGIDQESKHIFKSGISLLSSAACVACMLRGAPSISKVHIVITEY